METITLTPYIIKMRHKYDKHYFRLDDVSGYDFFELVKLHIKFLSNNLFKTSDTFKSLSISEDNCDSISRIAKDVFDYGHFGKEANIVNTNDNKVNYQKHKQQAVVQPFYFLMEIPKERNEGIIILQRLGMSGTKTVFLESISQYVNDFFCSDPPKNYIIEINPLVPRGLIERYLQNKILKIRYIKYGLQTDIANTYPIEDHKEEEVCSEYVLSARKKYNLPEDILNKIKTGFSSILLDGAELSEIVAIQDFEVDTVKLEFQLGKGTRTIDLSKKESFNYREDITSKVEIDEKTGHFKFESIDLIASNLLSDLRQEIWGKS